LARIGPIPSDGRKGTHKETGPLSGRPRNPYKSKTVVLNNSCFCMASVKQILINRKNLVNRKICTGETVSTLRGYNL